MAEAVCIASGPSLTVADVELVRQWRSKSPDRFVIVANLGFRIAPWADAMYGMDDKFWKNYGAEINAMFPGKRYCHIGRGLEGIAENIRGLRGFMPHGNSGAALIGYCAAMRYERIILLGYDCTRDKGRNHWHADHPKGLGNCGSILRWPHQFANVRAYYRNADIVNASRKTALKVFPRIELEDALGMVAA